MKKETSFNSTKKITLFLLFFLLLVSINMNDFTATLALISIALYLTMTVKIWTNKGSSKLAILILASSLILILAFDIKVDIINVLKKFKDVYWLLLAISLLRILSKYIGVSSFVSKFFIGKSPRKSTLMLSSCAAVLSWPLSLGVVPILIDTLKQSVNKPYTLAAISMRIVCATMLLMPTTIGSAAVFSTVPAIKLGSVMLIGLPLFIIAFILCQINPISFYESANKLEEYSSKAPIYYLSFFWILFTSGYFFLALNVIQSISLSGFILYGVYLWIDRKNIQSHLNNINSAFSSISSEVFLLLSCALLSQLAPYMINYIPAQIFDNILELKAIYIYGLIIFILPIFCIIGIHPMVLFSLTYPIFSSYIGEGAHAYIIWVMMFFVAQLLSPISINAIFAANSLQTSSINTSFVMHIKYLLIFSPITIIYLAYIAI